MASEEGDAVTAVPAVGVAVGYESACVARLPEELDERAAAGFSFLVVPLAHPRYIRGVEGREEPWTRSDKLLGHAQYSTVIVGRVSRWAVDALTAPCVSQRVAAESALSAELEWAAHIGCYAALVDAPLAGLSVPLAALLRRARGAVWLRLRWQAWSTWQQYSTLLEHSTSVAPVLQLCGNEGGVAGEVQRWLAEPLRAVFVSSHAFPLSPKTGNPVLPRLLSAVLYQAHSAGVQLVLQGRGTAARPIARYREYLALLMAKRRREAGEAEADANAAYNNVLQAPLQPLADHLESGTYEVFESDPVKYRLYEDAIAHLLPRYAAEPKIVLMVAGAGRGPLVNAALRAARRAGLLAKMRVFAIEKNPNAVQTLRNMAAEEAWQEVGVRVVAQDMREWRAPERAHVLVSELLGSFGDNELSPECLDGAMPLLRPGGASVPAAYSSLLAPVSAPKVWQELHAAGDPARLETPYVVKLQHVFSACGAAQVCFTFQHPAPASPEGNRRYKALHFQSGEHASVVHGFAGYFECLLAEGAPLMSTAPQSASPGMFSWFPLFLPLHEPVALPPHTRLTLHIWRCVAPRKVWYEWALSAPVVTPVHNANGRSYGIGL